MLAHLRFGVAPMCRQVGVGEAEEGRGGMMCGVRRAGFGAVFLVEPAFLHRAEVFESNGKTQVIKTCLYVYISGNT